MMPPVMIVFLTFARTEYALQTIEAARSHLLYDNSAANLLWYVSDDGSDAAHHAAVLEALNGFKVVDQHNMCISYGAGANRALRVAKAKGLEFLFFLEDDWALQRDFDLAPYVNLLMHDQSVGMVRLGYLNQGMVGRVFTAEHELFWRLNRAPAGDADHEFVFTGHPSLRHARFHDAYGFYRERLWPGDTEMDMNHRFRTGAGPDIVWPAMLGQWGPFAHIGQVQSYHVPST